MSGEAGAADRCGKGKGHSLPVRYMCYDTRGCKEGNPFFCENCVSRHQGHQREDLEIAGEFSKKLRRLTQYDQLLESFQKRLSQQLDNSKQVQSAALEARSKLMLAAGTTEGLSGMQLCRIIRMLREKSYGKEATAQICSSFRSFVLSINYKSLSGCISNIKKALERIQQSTYINDLVLKIFTFESGSKEMYSQIKLDLSAIADRAVESKVDTIKRRLSGLQQRFSGQGVSQISMGLGLIADSQRVSGFEDILSELDQLVSKRDRDKRSVSCTDEFDTHEHNLLQSKLNSRLLFSKAHAGESGVSTQVGSKIEQPNKSMCRSSINKNLRKTSGADKISSRLIQPAVQVQTTPEERSRLLKQMQELKGNFSELFIEDTALRWDILRQLDLQTNTKILRLSNIEWYAGRNRLQDVTPLGVVNLKNLKYLHLSTADVIVDDNNITDLGQLEAVDFKNLQVLSLDNNKIVDLSPLSQVNLRCLQVLSLNGNLIDSFDGLEQVNFRGLQGLALSSNQLEDPKPLKSINFGGVFWMQLKNNPLGKDNTDWLKKLTIKNSSGSKICVYV